MLPPQITKIAPSVLGFPSSKLSELHGNIYTESCSRCNKLYRREYEVEIPASKDHEMGRFCQVPSCGGALCDNLVHFGDGLPWSALMLSNAKFVGSDLTVVLGSSLRVEPASTLPFRAKKRSRTKGVAKAFIVKLQES